MTFFPPRCGLFSCVRLLRQWRPFLVWPIVIWRLLLPIALSTTLLTIPAFAAEPVIVDSGFTKSHVAENLLFRPATSDDTAAEIVASLQHATPGTVPGTWHEVREDADQLPVLTSARYWFSFDLQDNTGKPTDLVMEFAYAYMYLFDVTLLRNGADAEHFITGHRFPFSQRPIQHPHFLFPLTINPGERITVVMLVQGAFQYGTQRHSINARQCT